jgi:hypothetical protein
MQSTTRLADKRRKPGARPTRGGNPTRREGSSIWDLGFWISDRDTGSAHAANLSSVAAKGGNPTGREGVLRFGTWDLGSESLEADGTLIRVKIENRRTPSQPVGFLPFVATELRFAAYANPVSRSEIRNPKSQIPNRRTPSLPVGFLPFVATELRFAACANPKSKIQNKKKAGTTVPADRRIQKLGIRPGGSRTCRSW